ncbi:MAG: AAA family ATPase, partial [Cyanobacteria bacterium J06626_18]
TLDPGSLINPADPVSEALAAEPLTSNFYAYDPDWVGREPLIESLLTQMNNACRLLMITGIAGVGKTALAELLTLRWTDNNSQFRLIRANFDGQDPADSWASTAAQLLEDCGLSVSPEERADAQLLNRRLVQHLQRSAYILLIDSLEEIMQGNEADGWSRFKDSHAVSFFQAVLAAPSFSGRIMLTSQELPSQLVEAGSRYRNFWFHHSLSGLSDSEQQALFDKAGFEIDTDPSRYLPRIGQAYEGHPLAIRVIMGEISSRPFFGDVTAYWQRYGDEIEEVERAIAEAAAGQVQGGEDRWRLDRFTRELRRNVNKRLEQTFARLERDARYAYILLCEAAVYRCAVPDDWWLSHLEDWEQTEEAQVAALDALRDRNLVEEATQNNQTLLRQHNLIRSLSLKHLQQL